MKVLGVIPARYNSSRFQGKPLIDISGKTMIQRVYEGAKACALIDELIVATDDERIFNKVKSFGGNAVMTSESHQTGTDRCGEVAKIYPEMDVIINIQGDEPLIDPNQLAQVIEVFNQKNVNIATLGIKIKSNEELENPNRIKVVLNKDNEALYFSRSSIPNSENFKKDEITFYPFIRHIGLYAFRKKTLLELVSLKPTLLEKVESLEQLRWMFYGHKIKVLETTIETPNIDVPEDLEKVIKLLK